MIRNPKAIGIDRPSIGHTTACGHKRGVADVEVVQFPRFAVGIEYRFGGIGAETTSACDEIWRGIAGDVIADLDRSHLLQNLDRLFGEDLSRPNIVRM